MEARALLNTLEGLISSLRFVVFVVSENEQTWLFAVWVYSDTSQCQGLRV